MPRHIVKSDIRPKLTANIEGACTQADTPSPTNIVPVLPLQIDPISGAIVKSLNLRKIDDTYKDIYDYQTRKITRNVGVYVFTGQEGFSSGSTSYPGTCYWKLTTAKKLNDWTGIHAYCTHFKCAENRWTDYTIGKFLIDQNADVSIWLSNECTAAQLKTFLQEQYTAGTPVTVYYKLATPVEDESEPIYVSSLATTKITGEAILSTTGKNIFELSRLITVGTKYEDGTIKLNTSDGSAWTSKPTLLLKPGVYTVSAQFTQTYHVEARYSTGEGSFFNLISTGSNEYKYQTFTVTEDSLLVFKADSNNSASTNSIGWIMIEKGDNPTLPFEKYTKKESYLPQTFHSAVRTQEVTNNG